MLKQEYLIFCTEYISNGGNAQEAYRVAYTQTDKVKAAVAASRLMKRSDIREYIEEQQEAIKNKGIWDAQEILQDLKEIATDINNSKNTRLKAYQLGMNALGMNKQTIKHSGNTPSTDTGLGHLSVGDLKALLDEDDDV